MYEILQGNIVWELIYAKCYYMLPCHILMIIIDMINWVTILIAYCLLNVSCLDGVLSEHISTGSLHTDMIWASFHEESSENREFGKCMWFAKATNSEVYPSAKCMCMLTYQIGCYALCIQIEFGHPLYLKIVCSAPKQFFSLPVFVESLLKFVTWSICFETSTGNQFQVRKCRQVISNGKPTKL